MSIGNPIPPHSNTHEYFYNYTTLSDNSQEDRKAFGGESKYYVLKSEDVKRVKLGIDSNQILNTLDDYEMGCKDKILKSIKLQYSIIVGELKKENALI